MPWSQAAPGDEMSAGREQKQQWGLGCEHLSCPAPRAPPELGQSFVFFPLQGSDNPCTSQSSWKSWKFAFKVTTANVALVRNGPAQELAQLPLPHSILGAHCHPCPNIHPQGFCF